MTNSSFSFLLHTCLPTYKTRQQNTVANIERVTTIVIHSKTIRNLLASKGGTTLDAPTSGTRHASSRLHLRGVRSAGQAVKGPYVSVVHENLDRVRRLKNDNRVVISFDNETVLYKYLMQITIVSYVVHFIYYVTI